MRFDIRFTGVPLDGSHLGNGVVEGELTFDDHREGFQSFIGFWSPSDYLAQWRDGAARAARLDGPSCLITSITDPAHADYLRWWLLYPSGGKIIFQEALLFLKELTPPFSTRDPYASIPAYKQYSDEGERISEWVVPVSSVIDFLKSGHG